MTPLDVYLSLGTNEGDRRANIGRALALLDERMGGERTALSSIIESRSWGFEGGDFLNCVVRYCTALGPEEILSVCKGIEKEMGRREVMEYAQDGSRIYHDRIIDIDILLYGDRTVDTPSLKIPHPLMKERDFIMRPLLEILGEKA